MSVVKIAAVKIAVQLFIPTQIKVHLLFFSDSETFFGKDGGRIGGQYVKVMYKEFTDSSFTTPKPQLSHSQHLGLFGMDWNMGLKVPILSFSYFLAFACYPVRMHLNVTYHPQFVQVQL